MIPLRDENPTRSVPVLTVLLIVACVAIFVFIQPRQTADPARQLETVEFTFQTAAIPCEVIKGRPLSQREIVDTVRFDQDNACQRVPSSAPAFPDKSVYLAVLYSMFLHGSWLHLGGNMLFLWIFGNNIEDKAGKPSYLVFYLLAGLAATAAHIAVQPESTVPVVGASGAIAGIMGAYLVLWPHVRIHSLIFLGFIVLFRDIEAKWLLGIWFVSQFFINPAEGVAWVAHVGGFVFGVVGGLLWRLTAGPEHRPLSRQPY